MHEEIVEEQEASGNIRAIIERAQKEVLAQHKERDMYRAEAVMASKQAAHLKDKTEKW